MTARTTALRLLLGVLVVVLAGCGANQPSGLDHSSTAALAGSPVLDEMDLPAVVLRDVTDQPYNVRTTPTTPLVVVVFGYTHCTPHCSELVSELQKALAASPQGVRDRVTALFVSCDPARDDPAAVRDFLAREATDMVGLTGNESDIRLLADQLGVAISKPEYDKSGGYHVAHGVHILAFDEERRARLMWSQGTRANEIAKDLQVLAQERR